MKTKQKQKKTGIIKMELEGRIGERRGSKWKQNKKREKRNHKKGGGSKNMRKGRK